MASYTTDERLSALLSATPETLSRIDAVLFDDAPRPEEAKLHRPMSIAEAARTLGKSRTTLHRWIERGVLKCVAIEGGNRLVPFAEIERIARGSAR